jgi:hypothetical protein
MVPGLALLREANKIFPETRIVWVAIAIVAALAIVDSFRLGWTVVVLGAIVILILLILFFLVSGICTYLADPEKWITFAQVSSNLARLDVHDRNLLIRRTKHELFLFRTAKNAGRTLYPKGPNCRRRNSQANAEPTNR